MFSFKNLPEFTGSWFAHADNIQYITTVMISFIRAYKSTGLQNINVVIQLIDNDFCKVVLNWFLSVSEPLWADDDHLFLLLVFNHLVLHVLHTVNRFYHWSRVYFRCLPLFILSLILVCDRVLPSCRCIRLHSAPSGLNKLFPACSYFLFCPERSLLCPPAPPCCPGSPSAPTRPRWSLLPRGGRTRTSAGPTPASPGLSGPGVRHAELTAR